MHCAVRIKEKGSKGKNIVIYSDSQAALKAISSPKVNSKLVGDCIQALEKVGLANKLTVAWVPGHEGHPGNEEADDLAKRGSVMEKIGL